MNSQRTVCIGGFPVQVASAHAAFWPGAETRYHGFFDETQEPVERVEIRVFSPPHRPPPPEKAIARVTQHNGTVRISWGNMAAEWHRAQRSGWTRQPETDFLLPKGHAPEYACDTYLRVMLSYRFPELGGFLLHAAGLVRNGKGYLFAGKSGAGKTTITRLSAPNAVVLNDDFTLVRLSPDGATVHGTPFYGEYGKGGANIGAPLAGIYFLSKANTHEAVPLPPQAAIARLFGSVLHFPSDRATAQALLDLATAICRRVPCFELRFLPDASFWSCINV
ncbi:MAG: hypothetical protein HZA23_04345 [Nitrospirae bacterium]|nr:hypothetical protein [Nitrospirota bacterium]